jgi:hypothetical protein
MHHIYYLDNFDFLRMSLGLDGSLVTAKGSLEGTDSF